MPNTQSSDESIVISIYPTRRDAEIARDRLESENIYAFITADDAGGVHPELQMAHGVKLSVLSSNAQIAREVLREEGFLPESKTADMNSQSQREGINQKKTAPSLIGNVESTKWSWYIAVIFLLIFAAILILISSRAVAAQEQKVNTNEGFIGAWTAEEDFFRPIIRFKRDNSGTVTAFLTNDQSKEGTPFSNTTIKGDSVFAILTQANVHFRGQLTENRNQIEGIWKQGKREANLTLTSIQKQAKRGLLRPQEPSAPFPYKTEEVTFRNASDGVTLTGILSLPNKSGPHPGVILISGTGPQDRNAEAHHHKPFLVLTDYLTQQGIAVLRYDKRGVGDSEGHFMSATFEDLAGDIASALRLLKKRSDILNSEIGLIGLSEGGYLAPLVHDRFERASFIVLLAAPSVSGEELLAGQNERALDLPPNAPKVAIDSLQNINRSLFKIIHSEIDSAIAAQQVKEILQQEGITGERLQRLTRQATAPGGRDFARYNPQPILRQLDIPVLALYGGKDLQVPPSQNVEPMRSALNENNSNRTTVEVLNGLNHMFQPADTGHPNEYHQIDTTIAPVVLTTIANWINKK